MKGRIGRASAFYLLVMLAGPVAALPREDEAHRIDRLQTKSLNDAALGRLAPAPQPIKAGAGPGPRMLTPAERTLKDAEDHAVEAWRRRAEACRAGKREAC